MTPEEEADIARFVKERNEVLLTLDEEKIRAFIKKENGVELPPNKKIFWGAIHKAITGTPSLPLEFRQQSKDFLDGLGLRSLDDGDLK